jgi:hypothetical protein
MGDASNGNDGKAGDSFAGWWLGGFGCAGAIVAGTLVAVVANLGFVESAGIAALGAIVGVVIGLRVAMTLVLLAEELLRWDEEPRLAHRSTVSTPRWASRPRRPVKVTVGHRCRFPRCTQRETA